MHNGKMIQMERDVIVDDKKNILVGATEYRESGF
ncbi:hypothetical protein [Bacillus sp. C1]